MSARRKALLPSWRGQDSPTQLYQWLCTLSFGISWFMHFVLFSEPYGFARLDRPLLDGAVDWFVLMLSSYKYNDRLNRPR